MRRLFVYLVAAMLLTGFVAVSVVAQTETGQITGTVTDPSKALVPNAKITVRSVGTEAVRSSMTSGAGTYTVTNLQPGVFDVTVEAPGFAKTTKRVQVTVGSRVTLDFALEVGSEKTVVEVVGEAGVAINVETQTLSVVIDSKSISELPTLTRNPYDLVGTGGNVQGDTPDGRGAGYSINGMRAASTNILLDGVPNNDEFTATVGQNVPLDSVQEFTLLTNNFTAEFGRASGGIVNLATKSGTNQFHGTVYEFNRVSRLASNSFDNNAYKLPKSVFTRNQFGYSIGGPVIKNKLFFFSNTEWTRIRSGAYITAWVPTEQLIAATNANTQGFMSALGKLRSGLVDQGTFTRAQLTALGQDPCRQGAAGGPCQALSTTMPFFRKVSYTVPNNAGGGIPQDTYQSVNRIDYNFSDRTQFYGRYAFSKESDQVGTVSHSPYAGFDSPNTQFNNSVMASATHTFNPRLVGQAKVSFNRFNNSQPLGAQSIVPSLYYGATSFLGTRLALPGYLPYSPGNGIPFGGPQNFLQTAEDVSWTKGKHQLRFGGQYTYLRDNRAFGAYAEANLTLGTNLGTGLDNYMRGLVRNFQAAVYPQGKYPGDTLTLPVGPPDFTRSNRYHEWAFYAQDSWKVTPRVTLNLGIRWEYFGVQHNKDPKKDSNYYDGAGANIFERVRNGRVFLAPDSPVGGLWAKDWTDFAPRIGVAWDVFGDGKTSFRAGYGIGYERNFGNVTFNVIQNPPNYAVVSLIAGTDVPTIPLSPNNAGPLAGTTGTKVLPGVSLRNVESNIRTAFAHTFSASVEREVGKGLLMALEYSASIGEGLYTIENPNRPGSGNIYLNDPCTPGDCNARLRTTQYTNINRRGALGFSNYNGLNLRTQVQNIRDSGVTLSANWTWSHGFDNLSDTFSSSGNQYNLGLTDPFNPDLDRGPAQFDHRHRLAVSGLWDIPFAKNLSGPARYIFHGWVLAPIWTATTGAPFTIYDTTNSANVYPRVMLKSALPRTGPSNPKASGTPNNFVYIDLPASAIDSTYVHPKTLTSDFGPYPKNMTGRNFFRGPGSWNLDLGIYKNTKITERFTVQLRGEMYNMFNHANLFVNAGDADAGGVSFVSASRDGRRNIQLALKLIF